MHKTLFVVDDNSELELADGVITFSHYLRDYPKLGEPKTRIINLCDTARYLSQGYYCSLLAEARQHAVVPSVKTINALRDDGAVLWLKASELGASIEELDDTVTSLVLCMGSSLGNNCVSIANHVFQLWAAPLMSVDLVKEPNGVRATVKRLAYTQLTPAQQEQCLTIFERSIHARWLPQKGAKKYRWEMAILVNHNESVPPSDKGALTKFVKAAAKLGIRADLVQAEDIANLNEYDALFIRETTAIDHITYRLVEAAERQGLIVIDDSDSILRCCNKAYLHDAFNYKRVPSLKTEFLLAVTEANLDQLEAEFDYPMVLKMPEGSFSRGVFKVTNRAELQKVAEQILDESAMCLVQEYLFTEFDWRIGVLNGSALYACRYYMAKNHWQIYNHKVKRGFSGGFDALPTFEVPRKVLDAALKAAAVVGNGFYGIDVKEHNGKAYVLEVNDNPSIEHNVEDAYLKDELYMQIMGEFLRRLEHRGQ